jgi:hypothetical protein
MSVKLFSRIFSKALRRIEVANATDQQANAIINSRRDNPIFRKGEIVAVYDNPSHGRFMSYGSVVNSEWNAKSHDHDYIVKTQRGIFLTAPADNMRWVPPDEARRLFMKIRGGFPELDVA